jgi:ribonuclease D
MNPLPPELKRAHIIRHASELRRLVEQLKTEPLLAIDTESNSLYAYYERVCLVQLSTRQQDYIIDPLAVTDMSPLGTLLADPAIEIIFHAAEYDIMTLKRDFSFTFSRIFDTMLAARICGWGAVGLGNILADQFGVLADKRFQRSDWSIRPLPDDQLLYAQMDTHYLADLRDRLLTELRSKGREEEAYETFAELAKLPAAKQRFDPEGYWRIGAARDLSRNQMAIVRELYLLRDEIARKMNQPPFRVLSDLGLTELARIAPRRPEDLYGIKGIGAEQIRRHSEKILQAVARGRQAKPPRPPQAGHVPDPAIQLRYEALREWRKQRAQDRGVESDVIIPRDTLWALARRAPSTLDELVDIPGLGPWRRQQYGEELLKVIANPHEG